MKVAEEVAENIEAVCAFAYCAAACVFAARLFWTEEEREEVADEKLVGDLALRDP